MLCVGLQGQGQPPIVSRQVIMTYPYRVHIPVCVHYSIHPHALYMYIVERGPLADTIFCTAQHQQRAWDAVFRAVVVPEHGGGGVLPLRRPALLPRHGGMIAT